MVLPLLPIEAADFSQSPGWGTAITAVRVLSALLAVGPQGVFWISRLRAQASTFRVSRAADALVNSQNEDACRQSALPYGDSVRTLQVDMIAFNADQTIRAYDVKRVVVYSVADIDRWIEARMKPSNKAMAAKD